VPITRAVTVTLPVQAVPVRRTPLAGYPPGACPTRQRSQHDYACERLGQTPPGAGQVRGVQSEIICKAGRGYQQLYKMHCGSNLTWANSAALQHQEMPSKLSKLEHCPQNEVESPSLALM